MKLNTFVHGILGISQSLLNINTNDKIAINRLAICHSCEFVKGDPPNTKCGKCSCFLKYKTRLIKEKCPLKKW